MKVHALRGALALALVCSFAAFAGQDRALYPPAGGPGQGGVIRALFGVGSPTTYWTAIEGGGIYKSTDAGASWHASHQGLGHKLGRGVAVVSGSTMYAVTNGGGGFYKRSEERRGGEEWRSRWSPDH